MIVIYKKSRDSRRETERSVQGNFKESVTIGMDDITYRMLDMVDQPVILLDRYAVIYANSAARKYIPGEYYDVRFFPEHLRVLDTLEENKTILVDMILNNLIYTAKVSRFGPAIMLVLNKKSDPAKDVLPDILEITRVLGCNLHNLSNNINSLLDRVEDRCGDYPHEAAAINRSIYRLQRMMLQAGDMARLTDGTIAVHRCTVSLGFFVESFAEQISRLIQDAGWKINLDLCERDAVICIDPHLVHRALFNLILNALQHTPRGEAISLSVGCTHDRLLFCISNPGEPTPPQVVDPLISEKITRAGRGLGLGIQVANGIAQIHGGTLICTSNPDGKGMLAMFSIDLTKPKGYVDQTVHIDYYGGRYPALVELADVLDASFFHPDKV